MFKNKKESEIDQLPQQKAWGIEPAPEETILEVTDYEINKQNIAFSAVQALKDLASGDGRLKVKKLRQIYSPLYASKSYEQDNGSEEEHQGLYDVLFFRDALVVAHILFDEFPQLTKSTTLTAFECIGVADNYMNPQYPFDEQEIGKVPHELRTPDDPIAQKLTEEYDWGWPYYGAVDTTGKNIIAVTRYVEGSEEGEAFLDETFVGRDNVERTVKEGFTMNVAWLTGRMDLNPEGLVESLSKSVKHHANQTWADSEEAFHHADGSWAEFHPENNFGVAGLEQQGEAYAALRSAARLFERLGDVEKANELNRRADNLRKIVLEKFWVDDKEHYGGYFGRGTDRDENGNLRVLAIRSSDMGLLLNSGILDDTDDEVLNEELSFKREAVIQNLLSEEMLGLNGIRTLSSDSLRYGADRYHNGTTWPWVTYLTAQGLRRYGHDDEADDLEQRIMTACEETGMLPEYFSGSDDPDHRLVTQKVVIANPTLPFEKVYVGGQPAQMLQAWTVAVVLAIKLRRGKRTYND